MLDKLLSSSVKLRLAIWLVELALPNENELKGRLRAGLVAVLCAVASAILLAFTCAIAIFGIGYMLQSLAGLTTLQATLITAGMLIVVSVILLLICRSKFNDAVNSSSKASSLSFPNTDELISELFKSFNSGLKKPNTEQ